MSTRAQIRFATREDGVSFSEHPEKIHAQFYRHTDGYPEGLGVDIANSLINSTAVDGRSWEIESLTTKHSDLEYMYYIWQKPNDSTWISIFELRPFEDQVGECIFVGEPQKLLDKYKLNTNEKG